MPLFKIFGVCGLVYALMCLMLLLTLIPEDETLSGRGGLSGAPTEFALEDIPPHYLVLYQDAATSQSCPIPWAVLAAVGKIESDHGRWPGKGITSGHNDWGAAGPMQFGALDGSAAGNSWGGQPIMDTADRPDQGWGMDGDDDGVTSVYDPADAIPAAANYLCDHGADGGTLEDIRTALYGYNHAWWYVDKVMAMAGRYAHTLEPAHEIAAQAIDWATSQVGVYYFWGGTCDDPRRPGDIPGGAQTWSHNCDCASLIRAAYEHAGITIGGWTGDQVHDGVRVDLDEIQPGDLIFSATHDSRGVPQHVVMYIGSGQTVHSPRPGRPVEIVDTGYHLSPGWAGQVRRVVPVQG
ncbi:NlpC/P60 family protein [Nocardiopsis sp. NRRL B-16309]|uniref:C40 family peptidase n=1 Tax=Nocardiopsis sp. NRRL B-16309 TaxID=1519494 RepID=UPI0006ADE379|nr:NlpC/P60 family protein [Nocardiopsis sp. NRRL B-16309]